MRDPLSVANASNVVLIGCHRYTALEELPAVERNLTSLRDMLTNPRVWGVGGRIEMVQQPSDDREVLSAVKRAARSARDTLVVYYAGHGLIDPFTDELYLALTESREEELYVERALRFELLRRVIGSSGADKKVLLLDCCYSGLALSGAMGGDGATHAADHAIVEGVCVITSASETARSVAPPRERFTAFTGALLDTLEMGVPGAGAYLDMTTLYDTIKSKLEVRRIPELEARRLPEPQMRNRNTAGRICIARNLAPAQASPSSPAERPRPLPPSVDGLRLEPSQVRIYSADGDVTGSGFLIAADVVCTCAHVVTQALRVPDTTDPAADQPLELDFPLLSGRPRAEARVIYWRHDEDVALLQLDMAVEGTRPAPLANGTSVWGHTVRVLGFPRHLEGGVWVTGALQARTADGWLQVETPPQTNRITAGFSGSPAWDEAQRGVAGMVVAAHRGEPTAYLLPYADLIASLPEWFRPSATGCPFPGLTAFAEDDAEFFYGREADTDRVHGTVCRQPVTLLTGPSGCGKSSLVSAGVLPRLRAEGMSVSKLRPQPGEPPAFALAWVLAGILEPELGEVERLAKAKDLMRWLETADDEPSQLRRKGLILPEGSRHVLFVDQLEQYVDAEPDAARSLFNLIAALPGQDSPAALRIVVTARPDSLHVLATPRTSDLISNAVQILAPLAGDDLKRAITAPVDAVPAVMFEPWLPERIVADAGDEPGRMPLVQVVLAELWQRRTDSMLTHAAYDSLGGLPGALVIHAERVLAELTQDQQECARRLFVQLARPGDGDTFIRRSAGATELAPEVRSLAKTLAHDRLIVLSHAPGGTGQEEIIDLPHEALTRLWPRLRHWLIDSRDSRLWQETLRADLKRWDAQGRDPDRLLHGADMAQAYRRMASDLGDLSVDERDYILLSLSHHSRRRVRLRQAVIGAVTVLTVLATVLVITI
ncbi:caspase, EACC1-associated type [Streptomyces purpurascens]|uniref:caspase, EACC1-associated type n=1 Tax=Streptomyces purpurascens TaxID=1924 RepID=UPI003C2D90AD